MVLPLKMIKIMWMTVITMILMGGGGENDNHGDNQFQNTTFIFFTSTKRILPLIAI